METKDIIYKTLCDDGGMLKSGELSEKTGIDKKEVDKAIKLLKKESLIESPKRCYYSSKN